MLWQWLLGAACAFVLAVLTTPAGVSGAVLLLPVQVSVLGVPSPAVTPTNLLYNVLSTPGALMRFAREGRLRAPLTGLLVAGTLPGVIVGAIVRVEWLSNSRDFAFVAAAVLLPLGVWLLLGSQRIARPHPAESSRLRGGVWALALVVGVVGGIYGIGGGSLLAPILIALGFSVYEVAPATLAATFLTSIVGIGTYQVLLSHGGRSRRNGCSARSSESAASLGATAARGCKAAFPSVACDACSAALPASSRRATLRWRRPNDRRRRRCRTRV